MTEASSIKDGKKAKSKFSSIFSTSCGASLLMAVYVWFAMFNLYGLMYPLTKVNLDGIEPESFIHPLWDTEAKMAMKVFLSTKPNYNENFLRSEFESKTDDPGDESIEKGPKDTVLLWEQRVDTPSLSKTFLISSLDCVGDDTHDNKNIACNIGDDENNDATIDQSLKFAQDWLDDQDKALLNDDGSILSTIQAAAGQGIESTSILLTVGQGMSQKLKSLLAALGLVKDEPTKDKDTGNNGVLSRSNVHLPANSPIWSALMTNSTAYIHVVLIREKFYLNKSDTTYDEALAALGQAARSHSLLVGKVNLIKFDTPTHLTKPNRILLWDLLYLLRKYILRDEEALGQRPPWDMEVNKPEYFAAYQQMQQMKAEGRGYPYWKPEVAVKYLIDEDSYPMDIAQRSGMVSLS